MYYVFPFHTARDVCPPAADQPEKCRTCCCKSSDNVEFLHPYGNTYTECGAYDDAVYKASLIPTISPTCHPDYPFVGGVDAARFSGLLLFSHYGYRVLDKCSTDIEKNLLFQFIVNPGAILPMADQLIEDAIEDGRIKDIFLHDDDYDDDDDDDMDDDEWASKAETKRRVGYINVCPSASYITLVSKLVSQQS